MEEKEKEEEIEKWYEAEKQKLEQGLNVALLKNKTDSTAESSFHKQMQELHNRYEARMDKLYSSQKSRIQRKLKNK